MRKTDRNTLTNLFILQRFQFGALFYQLKFVVYVGLQWLEEDTEAHPHLLVRNFHIYERGILESYLFVSQQIIKSTKLSSKWNQLRVCEAMWEKELDKAFQVALPLTPSTSLSSLKREWVWQKTMSLGASLKLLLFVVCVQNNALYCCQQSTLLDSFWHFKTRPPSPLSNWVNLIKLYMLFFSDQTPTLFSFFSSLCQFFPESWTKLAKDNR